ncbi:MAG: hypothetical protein EBR82_67650, partial [Caulobacteraceae bacterium]|nr:hypothetical protein [Caulobacteraceae bacterium]
DLLAFDGIRSFAGGQASGLQSDLLAENQVRELSNMTLSPRGSLETRRGILSFSTTATSEEGSIGGMRYYDTAATERLVTVTQGRVYTIDSTGSAKLHPADETWSQVNRTWGSEAQNWADGFSSAIDTPVKMAQFNDKMYMADGDGDLYYFDGSIVTRQAGRVRAITVTTAGSGYTSATAIVTGPQWGGEYPELITTVAGGAVTGVTVVDGGSGYGSAPTVTIIGDGSGATATATVSPPPSNLRLLINTGNRLFAVGSGTERNTLYASDILDASVWDSSNSAVINGDDGDEIVAIVAYYQNRIIVFKKRRIFQVTIPPDMTTAADWTIELISNNIGCVAEATAVQVNSDIFFLSDDGIRSLVRSAADDFTSVGLPISEVVKDVIQSINTAAIDVCTAHFYDNRYMLAFPSEANDVNDTILVYNTVLQAFEGTWTPNVMQFALTNFEDEGVRLMMKTTTGQINKYSGYKSPAQVTTADYQDAGVDYESYVRTKDFNFGDPFSNKYGSHFEVIFDDSFSTDASVSIQRDIDVGDIDVQPNLNISSAALTLDFTLPAILPTSVKKRIASDLRAYEKWRLLNIKITSAANKMAIRQITAAANPDTIEVQKSL